MSEDRDDHISKILGEIKVLQEETRELAKLLKEKPKKRDVFDILSSLSTVISAVIIGGVATLGTVFYNLAQAKIQQVKTLDQFNTYLESEAPTERVFAYEMFAALGNEELAARLIAIKGDLAGEHVLQILSQSKKKEIREEAIKAQELLQKRSNTLLEGLAMFSESLDKFSQSLDPVIELLQPSASNQDESVTDQDEAEIFVDFILNYDGDIDDEVIDFALEPSLKFDFISKEYKSIFLELKNDFAMISKYSEQIKLKKNEIVTIEKHLKTVLPSVTRIVPLLAKKCLAYANYPLISMFKRFDMENEIIKIKREDVVNEEKRNNILDVRKRWISLRNQEKESQNNLVRSCANSVILGYELRKSIQNGDEFFFSQSQQISIDSSSTTELTFYLRSVIDQIEKDSSWKTIPESEKQTGK